MRQFYTVTDDYIKGLGENIQDNLKFKQFKKHIQFKYFSYKGDYLTPMSNIEPHETWEMKRSNWVASENELNTSNKYGYQKSDDYQNQSSDSDEFKAKVAAMQNENNEDIFSSPESNSSDEIQTIIN